MWLELRGALIDMVAISFRLGFSGLRLIFTVFLQLLGSDLGPLRDLQIIGAAWKAPRLRTADRWGICIVGVDVDQWYQLGGSRGWDRACDE